MLTVNDARRKRITAEGAAGGVGSGITGQRRNPTKTRQIADGFAGGEPFSDGEKSIVHAGRASYHAFHQYERALRRLRDYVRHATIPHHLRSTLKAKRLR